MNAHVVAQDQDSGGTGFVLVHHASKSAFSPLRLMNPVTYLGRQPGNDVILESANVSRRHAKLIVTDLGVTAHDLDSHNGIFLNGRKVRSTPVTPGDLLYIGDMCVELRRAGDGATNDGGQSAVVHRDISDEEDPRARCLAALLRVATLCTESGDGWAPETVQICRALVEAVVAAFVEVHDDGELDAPVVLQPDGHRGSQSPVLWPVVRHVIASKAGLFCRDVVAEGIVEAVDPNVARAIMAAPVQLADGTIVAVLYLSRAQATSAFAEVEFETLGGIARLVAMRLDRERKPAEVTNVGGDANVVAAHARIAALEDQVSQDGLEFGRLTERLHALESENLTMRQQADLERHGAAKRDAERERETSTKLEAAVVEARRVAQREISAAQRDVAAAQKELSTTAANAQRDLAVAEKELSTAREEAATAAQQAHVAGAERESLSVRIAEVEEQLVAMAEAHQHNLHQLEEERQRAASLSITVDELQAATVAQVAHGVSAELESAGVRVAELEEQLVAMAEAHQHNLYQLEEERQRAGSLASTVDELRAELERGLAEHEALRTSVATLQGEQAAFAEASGAARASVLAQAALRQAMRTSVLPSIVDHVEAVAAGDAQQTSSISRAVTVVYLALADFDTWCEKARPEHVNAHLNTFCSTVASRAQANGGRIDQVIGHGHLLVFPADPAGARAAVRCAIEVSGVVEADAADAGISDAPFVVAGLHSGTGVAGFFGDQDGVSYVEAGLPVVIARAAVDFAPKGPSGSPRGVLVSDAVRAMLAGEVGFRVTRLDPSWIRGVNAPVQLALVDLDHGGDP